MIMSALMLSIAPDNSVTALHVAVGVITDNLGNILLTQRAKHVHQGGLWEFPGGKLELGESVERALIRELQEEVGILVELATPLIKVRYDYGDRCVLLDVWRVSRFSGQAMACEGQSMCWLPAKRLGELSFPAANYPIIKAAQLPSLYAILEGQTVEEVLSNCRCILQRDIKLLQLRIKSLSVTDVEFVLPKILASCQLQQVKLLINSDLPVATAQGDGIHLTSRALLACRVRPKNYAWVAASCHNLAELKHAEQLGVDFAVLAAVQSTATHPKQQPLGWDLVSDWIDQVNIPVYVMGGLTLGDLDRAFSAGAQGVAGISAFLD
ncbi:Nudix family hydrolase [Methylomonas sp. AM2-LC]|uniref:Nudix family hydrolase n=1 Tax=Methylomonas sp. AM2-LC TaxID=3153301 RepID=UPI003264A2CF